jgi:hypothetical protein
MFSILYSQHSLLECIFLPLSNVYKYVFMLWSRFRMRGENIPNSWLHCSFNTVFYCNHNYRYMLWLDEMHKNNGKSFQYHGMPYSVRAIIFHSYKICSKTIIITLLCSDHFCHLFVWLSPLYSNNGWSWTNLAIRLSCKLDNLHFRRWYSHSIQWEYWITNFSPARAVPGEGGSGPPFHSVFIMTSHITCR